MSENLLPLPMRHVYNIDQLTDLLCKDAERRQELRDSGKAIGPMTGLPGLDEMLSGCMEPGLYTVNGVPGVGKTALALQIATDCGCPAVFMSCEMAPGEIVRRLTARASHRAMKMLRRDPLEEVYTAAAITREQVTQNLHILDATTEPWAMDELRRAIFVLMGEAKFGVVVVDSLHAWVMSGDADTTEYDALNRATLALRKLAHDYNVSVIQIAERNRASMASGGLHSSAGSRRIEFASDVYLDMQKAEDQLAAAPGGYAPLRVTLTAEKNRFGIAHEKLSLLFDGRHQTFREE